MMSTSAAPPDASSSRYFARSASSPSTPHAALTFANTSAQRARTSAAAPAGTASGW